MPRSRESTKVLSKMLLSLSSSLGAKVKRCGPASRAWWGRRGLGDSMPPSPRPGRGRYAATGSRATTRQRVSSVARSRRRCCGPDRGCGQTIADHGFGTTGMGWQVADRRHPSVDWSPDRRTASSSGTVPGRRRRADGCPSEGDCEDGLVAGAPPSRRTRPSARTLPGPTGTCSASTPPVTPVTRRHMPSSLSPTTAAVRAWRTGSPPAGCSQPARRARGHCPRQQ